MARRVVTAARQLSAAPSAIPSGEFSIKTSPGPSNRSTVRLSREVSIDSRTVLRLLGPGDVLIENSPEGMALGAAESWRAAVTTRLAILDDRLLLDVRHWPRLFRAFCSRLQDSHDVTLLQLAVSHRPAAEDRILGLFELLAASWGRVGPDGILVPIPLTHEAIGQMIGSRRPTVTLALQTVTRQGRLQRVDGGWLLPPNAVVPKPP